MDCMETHCLLSFPMLTRIKGLPAEREGSRLLGVKVWSLGMVLLMVSLFGGCGATKWTETKRTATEQLLISDAMDQAVSRLDLHALAGKSVYLDDTYLKDVVDAAYLVSSLRQQMLAHGAILKPKREEADYIVEVRSGAVGTDMHSMLIGVPQLNLPSTIATAGLPSNFPEIPLIKRTKQTAVTKILLFAYNRETGRPLWQSGKVLARSDAQDIWFFGAGPFQRGSIYDGTRLAGDELPIRVPLVDLKDSRQPAHLLEEAYYVEPQGSQSPSDVAGGVQGVSPDGQGRQRPPATEQTVVTSGFSAPASWGPAAGGAGGPVFPPQSGPFIGFSERGGP
ncbi:MAG: DUF6655 family protein [Thermogutta sp.]